MVAALEEATGATAESFGKPAAQVFHTALDRLGDGRALGVGDRLDADLQGAHAAGIDGAIVLSGATTAAEADAVLADPEAVPRPVAVAPTLGDLVLGPS